MKHLFTIIAVLLVAATTVMAQDGARKYGVKSAAVKIETEMMGQKILTTSWFDNYGALEASVSDMGVMKVATILKDGKTWMVNEAARQVQEMPAQEGQVNYLNLTDEIVAKYSIKDEGKETVAGKECTKYSMKISQMGQTVDVSVSVWNGYPMKTISSAMGSSVTATVTEFVEGPVDPAHFDVPQY